MAIVKEEKTILTEKITCYKCGIPFWLDEKHVYYLRQSHESFYCPRGHSQYFPAKSEKEELQDKLQKAARDREYLEADLQRARDQRDYSERSKAAYKGQITKLKKRAVAGICPCCNRHFVALERHMANKHPEYAADES